MSTRCYRPGISAMNVTSSRLLCSWQSIACKARGFSNSNFKQLAGGATWGTATVDAAAHVKNWTRDEDLIFLENKETGEFLHTVGATYGRDAGKHFQKYLAQWRPDIDFSSKQWKGLFQGTLPQLHSWFKVPRSAAPHDLELKQRAQAGFAARVTLSAASF